MKVAISFFACGIDINKDEHKTDKHQDLHVLKINKRTARATRPQPRLVSNVRTFDHKAICCQKNTFSGKHDLSPPIFGRSKNHGWAWAHSFRLKSIFGEKIVGFQVFAAAGYLCDVLREFGAFCPNSKVGLSRLVELSKKMSQAQVECQSEPVRFERLVDIQ